MENAEPLSGLRQRRPLSSQQSSQQAREERRDKLSALRERETVSKNNSNSVFHITPKRI